MINPFAWLETIKTGLIVGAIALTIGFGGGYYTKGKFVAAAEVTELKKDAKISAENVVTSLKESEVITAKVTVSNQTGTAIQVAADKRIINQQKRIVESNEKAHIPEAQCPAFTLDVGTVGLLNAARQGAAMDTTRSGDAALNAPSAVGIEKLIQNDLEVVKLYEELAIRHDALVDAVENRLADQAK